MSFVSPQQRGYDSLSNSDLNQQPQPSQSPSQSPTAKVSMTPLNTFLPLDPLTSASAAPTSPVDSTSANIANSDRAQVTLPKVGETRCYWALLTPELHFLYLDPVLQSHLQEQADSLIGKSLITLVHPDEQASAKEDLGGVLDSRTLHGSVTRVRFSRLSRVRRQLGYQGPGPDWSDADKIAVDANYMAVDLVINWAADGLVLCFMHAVVDLNPRDNDEHNKTGWTNWCGTPHLSMEQVQLLYQRLYTSVPQPPSMTRVFQILLNQSDRQLWVTWPPDPATQTSTAPTSKDFAKLAEDIEINNATSSSTDAKTSCTRRYRATQMMDFGIDGEKEVESIFIPYGSIIFACHKVSSPSRAGMNMSHVGPPPSHHPGNYPAPHQHYYDPPPHSYSLPPVPHPAAYNGYPPPPPPYGPWPHEPPHGSYAPWPSQHHPMSSGLSVSSVRSSSYPAPQQHQWSSQPPSYMDQGPPGPYGSHSGGMQYGTPGPDDSPPSGNVVPPRGASRRGSGSTREQYGNGGRSAGNPPVGVSRCSSCKATQSPEWRKGPSGKKDLCNACGLRYARSRAKKEGGGAAARRRKDRTVGMVAKGSPSGSPVGMSFNNGLRGVRGYDEQFSTGSASGSDMYPPAPGHAYHEHTSPSPSPPSNSMNYVPYAHHSSHPHPQNNSPIDNRSGHFPGPPPPHTFYSVPPPPPNPAMHHMPHHNHPNSLPRLEPPLGPPYGRPVSPSMHSPASPQSASPLSVSLSAASFERERQNEKGREVAPSTSPAESRHSRFTP